MASSQYMASDDDAYIDVDQILERYRQSRSKIIFLVCAIGFIFFGTISGYSSLQLSTSRLNALSNTTVEMATVAVESEKCINNPHDKVCITAAEIVADPEKAKNMDPITGKQEPMLIVQPYDFQADPVTTLFAIILTQPLVLRLQ